MMEEFKNKLFSSGLAFYELEDFDLIEKLSNSIKSELYKEFGINLKDLNEFHKHIDKADLNKMRLKFASSLNKKNYASNIIYSKLRSLLINILGPDIVIQKNVGLSIQLPGDSSSLLHIHSDVYDSDCSPFEIVIWIPLVNCFKTKSMFYIPFTEFSTINEYLKLSDNLRKSLNNPGALSKSIEYIDISPPSIAFFSHSIWHGNSINQTSETRFSLNVRVKNLFTPYRGKKLGDFFKIAEISRFTELASEIEVLIND